MLKCMPSINVLVGCQEKKCRSHPGTFFPDRTPKKFLRAYISAIALIVMFFMLKITLILYQ